MKQVAAIILAAGRGTRMESTKNNKVVNALADKPMVAYTVSNLKQSGISNIIVVVGFASESVKKALKKSVIYALQRKRLGTGHAVQVGLSKVNKNVKQIISLYADDSAFYSPKLISSLLSTHRKNHAAVTVVTVAKKDPHGLGRILRDSKGQIKAIIEEKNATSKQKKITEINTGLYCFDSNFLFNSIRKVKKNPISGEYYLTDMVEIARKQGKKVSTLHWADNSVWFGVNTREQLIKADKLMQKKLSHG